MTRLSVLALSLLAGACATAFEEPRNTVDLRTGAYMSARQPMQPAEETTLSGQGRYGDMARCTDADLPMAAPDSRLMTGGSQPPAPPLSPGDMVEIRLPEGEAFEGRYIIGPDGYLVLPHLRPVMAAGFPAETVEGLISAALIEGEYYRAGFLQLDLDVVHWAPVQVHVSGAVFQPGDMLLNDQPSDSIFVNRVEAGGDVATGRTLTTALSRASGIRPDADIRNVVVVRDGARRVYDVSGALNGQRFADPVLAAGDQVHILSRGCFQEALARPSRVTMSGVRVFMSNLTQPASSNAQSAISAEATSLPYGTRFLQALVSANCVGGIQATNANRWAVLISRNPVTGESEVIARSIEGLVRRADRDAFNPVMLPNDAIACYDSHVTNVRDVVSAFSDIIYPAVNVSILAEAAR